ncbi:MAG TPA: TetR/AcrR family transcriptional regulator [Bacillota bacterium]
MKISKRQAQKDQTRKQLIEVAFEQFARDGLVAARTSDIAEAAGVSHGTVFAHFATRDDLLIAVIEEFGSRVAGRIHELAGSGGSVREVLQAHLNGLIEVEPFYSRLVAERLLLPSEAQSALVSIQSAIAIHLYQAVEGGIIAGTIRNIPLHLLFNTWISLIHYYLSNADLFAPGKSVLRRYGPELLEHYLGLISLPGGNHE